MKTAIVTGASGGIGIAVAKKLVENGFFVFAQYNKNQGALIKLKEQLKEQNLSDCLFAIKFDLTDLNQISLAVNDMLKSFNHIDVLVNCAGVGLYKLITETTEEEWDKIFDVNVKGTQALTKRILPYMIDRKSGKIINVSSVWGQVGASMEVAYSASKSALIGYTKAMAKEVGPSGINVNCICPGVIDTAMNARFNSEEIKELENSTPLGRIGKPEEVAELVCFLSSNSSDFITGQVITIDGGFSL